MIERIQHHQPLSNLPPELLLSITTFLEIPDCSALAIATQFAQPFNSLRGPFDGQKVLFFLNSRPTPSISQKTELLNAVIKWGTREAINTLMQDPRFNTKPHRNVLFRRAAATGNIAVLEWARDHGCYFDADTFAFAAQNQQHDALKWLQDKISAPKAKTQPLHLRLFFDTLTHRPRRLMSN
jgi:hypothetical protein